MKKNNVYSEVNLHINWHVKENYRVLRDKIEDRVQRYITHRVVNTPQAILRAIGGTDGTRNSSQLQSASRMHPRIPPYFTSPDETNSMKGAMTTTSKPGIPPLKQRETSRYRGKWPEGP